MATRARIGIEYPSGQIHSIYVHNDGGIESLGKMLKTFFNSKEKIEKLINMGDASFIEKEIGESNSFHNTNYDCCLFYHRDRNEPLNIKFDDTLDEFLDDYIDYHYIYLDKWYLVKNYQYFPLELID